MSELSCQLFRIIGYYSSSHKTESKHKSIHLGKCLIIPKVIHFSCPQPSWSNKHSRRMEVCTHNHPKSTANLHSILYTPEKYESFSSHLAHLEVIIRWFKLKGMGSEHFQNRSFIVQMVNYEQKYFFVFLSGARSINWVFIQSKWRSHPSLSVEWAARYTSKC